MTDRVVWIALAPFYHNKVCLHHDIEYDLYTVVMNPKNDYRRIKKIMKAVAKRIKAVEPNTNIKYVIKNFKNEEVDKNAITSE